MHPINVTTASSIQGWQIEQYRGVVSAHVVAGTGIISDTFAAFSDLFGGRSKSYMRQLSSLYNEAVSLLCNKAGERRCNWVIGLKVDMDQISGKGFQMFMVTAIGTAVVAAPLLQAREKDSTDLRIFTTEDVEFFIKKREVISIMQSSGHHIGKSVWEFLLEYPVAEVADRVLLEWKPSNSDVPGKEETNNIILRYFESLAPDIATDYLYNALSSDSSAAAIAIINTINYCSLKHTINCFNKNDAILNRAALQTIKAFQPMYIYEDIAKIDKLITEIPRLRFERKVVMVVEKSMLGGEKEKWVCEYGHKNKMESETCSVCGHKKQYYADDEITPEKAVEILGNLKIALEECFMQ